MYGSLRSVEPGSAGGAPAAVPGRRERGPAVRTWRAFSPELADVLCVECARGERTAR